MKFAGSEMIKKIVPFLLWTSLGFYCFATSTIETPKECIPGTPDYEICKETCTEDIHLNQSNCTNTRQQPTINAQSKPQQQEVQNQAEPEVTLAGVMGDDLSTEYYLDEGITLQYSLILCFLSYFFITFF